MSDAKRDAQLRLKFDTTDAEKGMDKIVRDGKKAEEQLKKVEKAAEGANKEIGAADKVMGRYGEGDLSTSSMKVRRRSEKAWEKRHDAAMASVEQYRLDKHYRTVREATRNAGREFVRDHAKWQEDRAARLAASAERDNAFSSHVQWRQRGSGAGPGLAGRASGALNRMGIPVNPAAAGAGIAAAVLGASIHGVTTANNFMADWNNIDQNADMTTALKNRAHLEMLPVVGGAYRSYHRLVDSANGSTEFLRTHQLRMSLNSARVGGDAQNFAELNELRAGAQPYLSAAGTPLRFGSPLQQFDRQTVAGSIAHQEQMARAQSSDAAAFANRDAAIARLTSNAAQDRLREAEARYAAAGSGAARAIGRRDAAKNNEDVTGTVSHFGVVGGAEQAAAGIQRERAALEQLLQARREASQASLTAAESEGRARAASINSLQTEINLLQQKEQRLSNQAVTIGNMNQIDQRLGVEAVKQIQQYGWENVTPEVRERAQQIAAPWARMQSERSGEASPILRELRELGAGEGGSLAQIRGEQTALSQQVRQLTENNVNTTARAAADAVAAVLTGFSDIVRQRLENELASIRNQWLLRNRQTT